MQVVKECFERVRIIKGVNYGIITNEQIELLLLILYCVPHILVHRSRGACLD